MIGWMHDRSIGHLKTSTILVGAEDPPIGHLPMMANASIVPAPTFYV